LLNSIATDASLDLENDPLLMPEDFAGSLSEGMRVGLVGVNFKTAPIAVREKLAKRITIEALEKLREQDATAAENGTEMLLLSTCNRFEVYFSSRNLDSTRRPVVGLFATSDHHDIDSQHHNYQIYQHVDERAIEHICNVASGLDSLVVGEAQILSQVRDAHNLARQRKLSGPIIAKLASKACDTGREVRDSYPAFTNGSQNSVSLSVAKLVSDYFGAGKRPNILLVGSGKMIRLALRSFDRDKLGRIIVAARKKSSEGIESHRFAELFELPRLLVEEHIDAIVTATSSEDYIITDKELEPFAIAKTKDRHLLIVDMSVPRNVDPRVAQIFPNVRLLNLDDLKEKVGTPMAGVEGEKQLAEIQSMIRARSKEFMQWLREREEIAPVLVALRKKSEDIRSEEFQNALDRLPDLTPEQKQVVLRMSERIVRRLLHDPTANLKKLAKDDEDSSKYTELLAELFSLGA
jgi:glutamyl-tRNA reductase